MEINRYELPLHSAAERGDIDAVISTLSDAEYEVDAVDKASHHTALHIACEKGFIAIVMLLLDRGASLQRSRYYKDGYTALHMAVRGGSQGTVELLLQRGADVHSRAFGSTPLHQSCTFEGSEVVSMLLQGGSDVNAAVEGTTFGGWTSLHFAAMNSSADIAKLLLSCNANIGAVNKDGRTALHIAWQFLSFEVAELLLEVGGTFTSACGAAGASEVPCAVREDVVKRLLNCEADINVRDAEGLTALHWSCRGFSPMIAECVLRSGADINAAVFNDNDTYYFLKYTPLHFAVLEDDSVVGSRVQADLVELLLQWGGDVNTKNSQRWTPLTYLFEHSSDLDDDELVIAKIFAKHVAMMQARHLFVDESNLQVLSDHEPLREFTAACKAEIKTMQRTSITDSSVTFFNVLTKDQAILAEYMANESILNAFKSDDFERVFPIYAENLRQQFELGIERLDLLRKCDSVLNVSSLRYLPYVCKRKLNRCLINDDLQSILKSEATTQP